MILSKEERTEFQRTAEPLMAFLSKLQHPYVRALVDNTHAVLLKDAGIAHAETARRGNGKRAARAKK